MADILDNFADSIGTAPTTQDRMASFAAEYEQAVLTFLQFIIRSRESLRERLWRTDGLTPAQKVAALGTQAKSIFVRDAQLKAFVESQLAGTGIVLEGVPTGTAVTLHDDGTASITQA